jgi:hypothetical protein
LRFRSESGYFKGEDVVAFTLPKIKKECDFDDYEIIEYQGECITMNTWDIFSKNGDAIQRF